MSGTKRCHVCNIILNGQPCVELQAMPYCVPCCSKSASELCASCHIVISAHCRVKPVDSFDSIIAAT